MSCMWDQPGALSAAVRLQIGVFGRVDDFQRQLDRVARLLDTDYDDALSEMVKGQYIARRKAPKAIPSVTA